MTFPPDIEDNQNSDLVLARMKANDALAGIDTGPNSPMSMALAPVSIELAEFYRQLESMLWKNRLVGPQDQVATGADLDAIGEERGIYRLQGRSAVGSVRFTGPEGTVIPNDTIVTTLGPNVRRFRITAGGTIDASGVLDVGAEAVEVGTASNVPAGAVQLFESPISRTTVTNPSPFYGGVDIETDDAYRARTLEFVRDPPNGSNPAQYRAWAREIPGVGGAVTLRPGEPDAGPPGTVDLYLVDTDMQPASQALVDAVQMYIAPPRTTVAQDDTFSVLNASGLATMTDVAGAVGTAFMMDYAIAGQGQVAHDAVLVNLIQPGSWQARLRVKTNYTSDSGPLMRIDVWDMTDNVICATEPPPAPTGAATATWHASDLSLDWTDAVVPFYWDGTHDIRVIVTRLSDGITLLYVDSVMYRSRFSSYDREGLAPILDEVRVKPALPLLINVDASIHLELGYGWDAVVEAVTAAIQAYLRSVALLIGTSSVANDVIYGEVGAVIQITPGVDYYDPATLRVNGSTANITLAKREVAVLGTVTLTQV